MLPISLQIGPRTKGSSGVSELGELTFTGLAHCSISTFISRESSRGCCSKVERGDIDSAAPGCPEAPRSIEKKWARPLHRAFTYPSLLARWRKTWGQPPIRHRLPGRSWFSYASYSAMANTIGLPNSELLTLSSGKIEREWYCSPGLYQKVFYACFRPTCGLAVGPKYFSVRRGSLRLHRRPGS